MMWDDGYFFHGGGFMWVFWVLLIIAIVFIFQNMAKGNSSSTNESPLEILKKRYARGEIDEEEYEKRRNKLES
ncbi:MAG: SHOCT domain-containing protein [Gammaproteobacteria bacterium]|nr:SHOCT domain-containing protein [Gammaproteobacteria bacterium]